ncbi:MAG: GreA/GreB family elongation factor [Nitrospinales bacterium]
MRLPIQDKLEKQLKDAERELKFDIPKALGTAAAMGDLSENADYEAAKERQSFLHSRVSMLKQRLSQITSLNIERIPKDRSGLGSTLFLKEVETGESRKFKLVFPEEVNPEEGKISPASPIGKALLGKQEGDEVTINLPGGSNCYEIVQLCTIHEDSGKETE